MRSSKSLFKKVPLIAFTLVAFTLFAFIAEFAFSSISAFAAKNSYNEINSLLLSAESLFKSMKNKEYTAIWSVLTAKSKKIIIKNVYRESSKTSEGYSKEKIRSDFTKGGIIAKTYWDSFLMEFDPDMVLESSKWKVETIKNKIAIISIHYKESKKPALLKMYKEEGLWKTGIEETFGVRKILH